MCLGEALYAIVSEGCLWKFSKFNVEIGKFLVHFEPAENTLPVLVLSPVH